MPVAPQDMLCEYTAHIQPVCISNMWLYTRTIRGCLSHSQYRYADMVATLLLETWATEEIRHFPEYVGLTSAKRQTAWF